MAGDSGPRSVDFASAGHHPPVGRAIEGEPEVSLWRSRIIRIPGSSGTATPLRTATRFARGLPRFAIGIVRANAWISLTLAVSAAMIVALAITVIMPGYANPMSRLYSSKFGYGTVLR